jgi:hypothetical protein
MGKHTEESGQNSKKNFSVLAGLTHVRQTCFAYNFFGAFFNNFFNGFEISVKF